MFKMRRSCICNTTHVDLSKCKKPARIKEDLSSHVVGIDLDWISDSSLWRKQVKENSLPIFDVFIIVTIVIIGFDLPSLNQVSGQPVQVFSGGEMCHQVGVA